MYSAHLGALAQLLPPPASPSVRLPRVATADGQRHTSARKTADA